MNFEEDLTMKELLLGIDLGGTVTKVCLFDQKGREVAAVSAPADNTVPAPDRVERDAEALWQTVCGLIRRALETSGVSADNIASVGLTGYGNGICLADENGFAVGPAIVSTDDRGGDIVAEMRANGQEEKIYALTHQRLWSAQTGTLLLWLYKNEPERVKKARWFLGIKDYIRMKLCGKAFCEITEASSTGLMNLQTKAFDPQLFALLGLEECFRLAPPVLDCCESGGRVTAEAAALTGLAEGTPIGGAMFDVDASMLASGILDGDTLCMIAGTWSINEYLADAPPHSYGESTNSLSTAFLRDKFLIEESTPTSASNLDWFLNTLLKRDGQDPRDPALYEAVAKALETTSPEDSNAVFVPYLYASATHPDAKGCFLNLSGYTSKAHLIRAVCEGVVFSSVFNVRRLEEGVKTFSLARLSGGLTRSKTWTQMMADALGIPVEVPDAAELASLGACMAAGVGCGLWKNYEEAVKDCVHISGRYLPDPARSAALQKKYAAYVKAVKALDAFHESMEEER
jgi:L-xylulokinase